MPTERPAVHRTRSSKRAGREAGRAEQSSEQTRLNSASGCTAHPERLIGRLKTASYPQMRTMRIAQANPLWPFATKDSAKAWKTC